jgi:ATP-dependent Clp protease adaptor protein ClpS
MELETGKGTQVLEELETSEALDLPCHLVLLDDDSHTYAYVIAMLASIFGYSREKGFAIASTVDSQGQAIVMTAAKEKCLIHQSRIHKFGADPLMETSVGSMSAIIETSK